MMGVITDTVHFLSLNYCSVEKELATVIQKLEFTKQHTRFQCVKLSSCLDDMKLLRRKNNTLIV